MTGTHRIGVDIGGTFTDFTVLRDDGGVLLWKEDSTPDDPLRAIESGLDAIAGQLGRTVATLLAETRLFVHGTTIATNLLIQRRGPRTALLCTEGFRDVLHFRDGFKPARFDIHLPHPEPLVPRRLRLGVPERIGRDGVVVRPLDDAALRAQIATLRAEGVEAVAIAFLWSVMNPAHEQRAAAIVREELPGAHVVCSSDVLPELREWERTSATVLSAYIRPSIASYLERLERTLAGRGLPAPPLVMQVNGGCGRVAEIVARPVTALSSGPTAAPATALHEGNAVGARDLITLDIGGTSCDVCIVRAGQPAVSRTLRVDEQPLGVPGVEVHSVGAGGGSIAWVDAGGALRVGPDSAGAVPGPACYGQGGTRATVTDANLVLGALSPDAFLGGRRALRRDLAEAAVLRDVAEPLGLDVVTAAAGIRRVLESNMVGATRTLSTERGIDPRGFVVVVGGGAGGLHGAEVARQLGVRRMLVPSAAGTLCAFGMTVTDVRHDEVGALHQLSAQLDIDRVGGLLAGLEAAARERLAAAGFAPGSMELERLVDARYPGQVHELTVPVPAGPLDAGFPDRVAAAFHGEHERLYTYARPDLPVELLHWRVRAAGRSAAAPPAAPVAAAEATATPAGTRRVRFAGHGELDTAVHRAERLAAGMRLHGPAVIDGATTTILVGPGDALTVMPGGGHLVELAPAGTVSPAAAPALA